VSVRTVPFAELAGAVRPETRLVACQHVSWVTGELAPAELSEIDIPVVLDGAQGLGAIPLDVRALGCAAYAASGQKWMCGPDGTGALYVAPEWRERIACTRAGYSGLADPAAGLDTLPHADARRYGGSSLSAETLAFAHAAYLTLAEFGWEAVHERAAALAAVFADALRERGHELLPRDATTLVAWRAGDARQAEETRDRLADEGIVIRDLPDRGILRASVGAWNDEGDLHRLLDAL
jgi:L-cysteine/cystine lyase